MENRQLQYSSIGLRRELRKNLLSNSVVFLLLEMYIITCKIWFEFIWPNPFKPEFTIVIFIHYKPRIAVAILDL